MQKDLEEEESNKDEDWGNPPLQIHLKTAEKQ